jgi:TetR/AcrR family transcriptional regulator, transcriptional repressor for nem operon
MADAGLTRGGFYSYFLSKSELYVEALPCFFTRAGIARGRGKDRRDAPPVGPQVVRAYLSRQHFENVEDSCPMVALPGDVARGDSQVKQAFENVFGAMVRFLQRDFRGRNRDTATTAQALCVGDGRRPRHGRPQACGRAARRVQGGRAEARRMAGEAGAGPVNGRVSRNRNLTLT